MLPALDSKPEWFIYKETTEGITNDLQTITLHIGTVYITSGVC